MNAEVEKELTKNIEKVAGWVASTASEGEAFVREQAPLVAQEIVNWHFWSSVCIVAIMAALSVPVIWCIYLLVRFLLQGGANPERYGEAAFCVLVILVCVQVGLTIPAFINSYEAVKAAVAPRIVIIETLRTLK